MMALKEKNAMSTAPQGSVIQEHLPVLLAESIEALQVKPDGIYVDATFGRGGHCAEILSRLGEQGQLYAIDRDPLAIETALKRFSDDKRVHIIQGCFVDLEKLLAPFDLIGRVDGILFDLGVSSPQLDDAQRGFSFMQDGPLDMRMDPTQGVSAAEWINSASEDEIVRVLRNYGEERYAKRIAQFIVKARNEKPITRTMELADVITKGNPNWEHHKHPATRSFQAIRIFINQELDAIEKALPQALELLKVGGRLAAISFHSLEDRMVKQFLVSQSTSQVPHKIPLRQQDLSVRMRRIQSGVTASTTELLQNPRARSATLRIGEKLA